jgi:HK97 family phage major capsid protein
VADERRHGGEGRAAQGHHEPVHLAAGLTAGAPDTLLGAPLYTDPDVPVMAASAKSILYGDFSWYWIGTSTAS